MRFLFLACFVFFSLACEAQSRYKQADSLYQEALTKYRNRELTKANDLVEGSIQLQPTASAYYLSGLIYEAMDKDLRAVSSYESTLKLDPDYREAIFQKALIYLRYGDEGQAIDDFNYLINNENITQTRGIYFETDPVGDSQHRIMSVTGLKGRLYHYRGQAYQKSGNLDQALDDFTSAIAIDSTADYHVSRALVYHQMGRFALAKKDLLVAISLDPENQLAWYNLILIDPETELPDDDLNINTFGPTLSLLASRALDEGDYEKALTFFNQSIRSGNVDALTYINRGRVLLKVNKYETARNDFFEARRMEPTRFETLYLIGNSFFYQENFNRALAYYNEYLAVDPQNAAIWYNGAVSLLEIEQNEEACHYLNRSSALGMIEATDLKEKYCQ